MDEFAGIAGVGNPILTELRGIAMLERFKRTDDPDVAKREDGAVATADRPEDPPAGEPETAVHEPETAVVERTEPHPAAATPAALDTARARQRDEFGGVNWGASFFGWLVSVGIAALLTSLLVAAGAAIGLTESDVTTSADEITLEGGVALVVVLVLAYYTGGYVAGRMSRFDGARQGLATWAIGMIVTGALALAAVAFGDEYNVLEQLNLPALPVGDESLASGGAIALAAFVVGSALAAMGGGKVGERYHRRIDRIGFVD
jgi:hypothetical protein